MMYATLKPVTRPQCSTPTGDLIMSIIKKLTFSKITKRPIKNVLIYVLKDPITKEVRYVGKTKVNLKYRLLRHIAYKSEDHRGNWIQFLLQQNLQPLIEELEKCTDENWQEREMFWIQHYKDLGAKLTNANAGGLGGHNPSAETRAKMSEAKKGKTLKPHSEETRAKISATKKNLSAETRTKLSEAHKNPSAEIRAKMAAAKTGRKLSAETRAKMSAAHKNRPPISDETRAKLSAAKRNMSAETRAKMSEARKNISHETRMKLSSARLKQKKGPHTEETREKMSASHKKRLQAKLNSLEI